MNQSPKKISLVIGDDHPVVLEGIARVLESESDFDVRARCLRASPGCSSLKAISMCVQDA
jgi:DNA-binding NarL/FixJ family response regulator